MTSWARRIANRQSPQSLQEIYNSVLTQTNNDVENLRGVGYHEFRRGVTDTLSVTGCLPVVSLLCAV
jgi:hypothetical protein